MDYSNSFIPKIPSRYTLDKATMTESLIELQPGGSVSIRLSAEDIQTAPENMRLTIMADKYTDAYAPDAFVDIQITNPDVSYRFLNPIVDTNNGFCITELTLDSKEDYTDFVFTIRSAYAMKILSWELAGPASTSEEYIEEMRKELPRLLKDYNEMSYLVGQEETTICLISAFLVKNTDLNGHLQVSYRATEDCQVVMRAKDNDVTELFSPVVMDIKAGRGSIDIPHAYVEKFIGYHTFTCTLQATNGMLKIPTRAVLYTVDGGHLAERVMDVGMDVRDIVMRRIVTDRDPSYIYAIGVDDGLITVKARTYNEVANTAWEPRLLVGEGKDAAITFNGDWAQDENGWRLNTDEDPWIYWVDAENIFWAQYFDDEATKIKLATDVVDISVVMGWRNPIEITQDQGMIATYIKSDGTAYYRNYCIFDQQTKAWDIERELTQFVGPANNIYVFRTNDYRVGIRIQNAEGVSTVLLTERNWANMAIPAENIRVGITDIKIEVVPISYHDFIHDEHIAIGITDLFVNVAEPIYPTVVGANNGNEDEFTIWLSFSHEIYQDVSQAKSAFTIKDSVNNIYNIVSMEHDTDKSIIIFHMDHFAAASGDMTIIYDRTIYEIDSINQGSLFAIEPFSLVFTPNLTPPEGHALENITAAIVPTLTVTQVCYKDRFTEENVTAGIANINIIVTKVGSNPL